MSVIIDDSGIREAIARRTRFPGRTEAQIVNTALYWIANNAQMRTRSVPQSRIDSELNVVKAVRVRKNGKLYSAKKGKSVMDTSQAGGASRTVGVPLGVLIVKASMRPANAEKYNRSTNNRYKRPAGLFTGIGRQTAAGLMRTIISRMIKARHSSTQFLSSGWAKAKMMLFPYAEHRRGWGAPSVEGEDRSGRRGFADPAEEGGWSVQGSIENRTGMEGINAKNFNQALHLYGTPALQSAIDDEAAAMVRKADELMEKENRAAFGAVAAF